jgi:hypothetical protein
VGVMDSMMQGMVKAMPLEEREELLLKMMPKMMKQADMVKLMPNMLKETSGLISLWSLYAFIAAVAADEKAAEQLKGLLSDMHQKMPAMMEQMHGPMQPLMMRMMSGLMPKLMPFMAGMMPNMKEMMPTVMDQTLLPLIKDNPDLKDHMLGMMQTMFPHCAKNMFPLIEPEARSQFISRLKGIMQESAGVDNSA